MSNNRPWRSGKSGAHVPSPGEAADAITFLLPVQQSLGIAHPWSLVYEHEGGATLLGA